MLARFVSVVGGMTLPFLLYAALAVVLGPPQPEGWPRASRWRLGAAVAGLVAAAGLPAVRAPARGTSPTAVSVSRLVAVSYTHLALRRISVVDGLCG